MRDRFDTNKHYFGAINVAPEADIQRADAVGAGFQPTRAVAKRALTLAVGLLGVTADGAAPGGVAGIDPLEGHGHR